MTYCYEIPALSFAMAAVNGEDRDIYPFASHTFMDVWPQEQLRIMGGSEKWGFIQFWKCGVSDKAPTASKEALRSWLYWQYRAQQAAMLPHDTAFMWGCRAANRTMMAFGTDAPDTRFLRPHAAADAVKVTGSNVVVTAFVRPGRALLFVTNLARQPQTATVTADPARLFGSEAAGRTVSWRDVDDCPFPPPSGVATREEMKDLTPSTLAALPLGDEGAPREEEIEGLLGGWTPEDKKKAEYAIQPEGLSVVVPLRKQDYRAVEMAIEEEVPR
jgi:hypothetical protein